VRDSNEDDKYLRHAAFFVVDEADINPRSRLAPLRGFTRHQGIEQRTELRLGRQRPSREPSDPQQVQNSIQARDEYVQRVPTNMDLSNNALEYPILQRESTSYGRFDEAPARFEPMYAQHCGKDKYATLRGAPHHDDNKQGDRAIASTCRSSKSAFLPV